MPPQAHPQNGEMEEAGNNSTSSKKLLMYTKFNLNNKRLMKTSAKLAAALLLTAAYACQSDLDEKVGETKASPVCITASNNTQHLKTTLDQQSVSWIAGVDKLGVYSPQAKASAGQTGEVSNGAFTAASSGISSAFLGSMYWGTGTHSFYAYYPYNANAGVKSTEVPITLPAYQLQQGNTNTHIGNLDFMVATPVTAPSGNESTSANVDFKMNHAFTMLEFCLTTGYRYKGAKLYQISIKAEKNISLTSGTIDITQPTPSGAYTIANAKGENTVVLNIKNDCILSYGDSYTTAYMMILPVDLKYDPTSITVTTDMGVCVIEKRFGMNFERGKKYRVMLKDLEFDDTKTTDFDGNLYTSVKIGKKYWFEQNLKTTHINDGTPISLAPKNDRPAYQWYDGNIANRDKYGAIYNFYAVKSANLSPRYWHVATTDEWEALISYLDKNKGTKFPMEYGGIFSVQLDNRETRLYYSQKDIEGWWWGPGDYPCEYYIRKYNQGIGHGSVTAWNNGRSIRCVRNY